MTVLPQEVLDAIHALQEKPETISSQEAVIPANETTPAEEPKHYGWRMALNACC